MISNIMDSDLKRTNDLVERRIAELEASGERDLKVIMRESAPVHLIVTATCAPRPRTSAEINDAPSNAKADEQIGRAYRIADRAHELCRRANERRYQQDPSHRP